MNFKYFEYQDNNLHCENVAIDKIANEINTPFYLYSKNYIVDAFINFQNAFKDLDHQIFYAIKSCSNISILKILKDLGSNFDCNSGGELYRALKIGVNPQNILFTGVGKTDDEIRMGLEKDIYLFQIESEQEIGLLNEIAGSLNKRARISIRVNPDVNPKTHKYVATGLNESKFGVDQNLSVEIFKYANSLPNIEVAGIDMHIGSQITYVSVFKEAVEIIVNMRKHLREIGVPITHIDVGGGFGVHYEEEKVPDIFEFAKAMVPKLKLCGCKIFFEPGRYFTANAGILVNKVLFTKKHRNKNFLIVDGAMTELIRPALYDAYHHILPIKKTDNEEIIYDIVGPVCESGDFFALNRELTELNRDDLIAIMSAGSYGMVMSSNYNSRKRVPEILVDKDNYYVIRERDSYEDIIKNEILI